MKLSEMIGRCREDLNNRNNLEGVIRNEIDSAIRYYENKRFWWLDDIKKSVLNPGESSEIVEPADLKQFYKLTRDSKDGPVLLSKNYLQLSDDTGEGPIVKRFYRFRQSFFIRPLVTEVNEVFCHYRRTLLPFTSDDDENEWTTEAEELIRMRAVGTILESKLKRFKESDRKKLREQEVFATLNSETKSRAQTGTAKAFWV